MIDVSGWVLPVSKPSSTCFLTLMCLCLIRTRAWWIDLASPSLNTYGTKGVKIKFLARKSNSHLGLEPALEEVLDLEAEHVVQLHPVVPEDTGPHQPPAGDTVQNLSRWGMTFLDQELFSHLRRAFPSKSLLGAFSSRVSRSLAADLILARLYFTLHTCKKEVRKEQSRILKRTLVRNQIVTSMRDQSQKRVAEAIANTGDVALTA